MNITLASHRHHTGIILILATALIALSGCKVPRPNLGVHVTCSFAAFSFSDCALGFGTNDFTPTKGSDIASAIEPSLFITSTAGSNTSIPASGIYIIKLRNISGVVVAQQSFPWVRQGDFILPQVPASITAWMASVTDIVADISVDTAPFQVVSQPGTNILMATTTYEGVGTGVAAAIWTGNSSCNGPNTSQILCPG